MIELSLIDGPEGDRCPECQGHLVINTAEESVCECCGLVCGSEITDNKTNHRNKYSSRIFEKGIQNNVGELPHLPFKMGSCIGFAKCPSYRQTDYKNQLITFPRFDVLRMHHTATWLRGRQPLYRAIRFAAEVQDIFEFPPIYLAEAIVAFRKITKSSFVRNRISLMSTLLFINAKKNGALCTIAEYISVVNALGHDYSNRYFIHDCRDYGLKYRNVITYKAYIPEVLLALEKSEQFAAAYMSRRKKPAIPWGEYMGRVRGIIGKVKVPPGRELLKPFVVAIAAAYIAEYMLAKEMGLSNTLGHESLGRFFSVKGPSVRDYAVRLKNYNLPDYVRLIKAGGKPLYHE